MEMLIQNSRSELIKIGVHITDTFKDISERMLAEYGVQMDFANLSKGKEIDLNNNIIDSLKRNKQKLAVNTDDRLSSQLALNEYNIEGTSTTVIFGTIMLEPESVQPEEIYADEGELMNAEPGSTQYSMEITSDVRFSEQTELQRCRLCNIENQEMTSIFDTRIDHGDLATKIRDCFSIIVEETDATKGICQSCTENLRKYHEFREKVLKSNEKFVNSDEAQNNNRKKRESLERVCFTCCARFASMKELIAHCKGNEDESDPIWECNLCIARPSFTTKCSLGQHQIIHREVNRECLSCGTRFANLSAYNYHINGNENDRELLCHMCDAPSKTKCGLGLHKLTHKRKSEHECLLCGGRFATSAELACHMQGLVQDPELKCPTCDASFRTKCALVTHKIIHPESCQNIFSCSECGKPFKEKTDLATHVSMHAAEKPFTCDLCGKSFKRKLDMEMHRKVHGGDRPYKCPECKKCFANSARLREHKKLHIDEKPYKCKLCGKAFKRPNARKMHMIIHTGEKALKCDICGGSFSRGGDMKKHKILMHNL